MAHNNTVDCLPGAISFRKVCAEFAGTALSGDRGVLYDGDEGSQIVSRRNTPTFLVSAFGTAERDERVQKADERVLGGSL